VLDPRTFERVKVELGRCDVCGKGKAVYRSREGQANVCEACYARLVRERNRWGGGAVRGSRSGPFFRVSVHSLLWSFALNLQELWLRPKGSVRGKGFSGKRGQIPGEFYHLIAPSAFHHSATF
jgi:hypothetical protein